MFAVGKLNGVFYNAQSCTDDTYETVKETMLADATANGLTISIDSMTDDNYEAYRNTIG